MADQAEAHEMLQLKSGFSEINEGGKLFKWWCTYFNEDKSVMPLLTWDEPNSRHGTQPHASTSQADSLNMSPKHRFIFIPSPKWQMYVLWYDRDVLCGAKSILISYNAQQGSNTSIHLCPLGPVQWRWKSKSYTFLEFLFFPFFYFNFFGRGVILFFIVCHCCLCCGCLIPRRLMGKEHKAKEMLGNLRKRGRHSLPDASHYET